MKQEIRRLHFQLQVQVMYGFIYVMATEREIYTLTVHGMFIEEKQVPSNLKSMEGNIISVSLDVL